MKTETSHYLKTVYIFIILRVTCLTLCTDFFDHIAPISLCAQVVEICMRIISDSTKNYDEATQIDLCVGRLVRLNAVTGLLLHNQANIVEHDIKYLISLTHIAKTRQKHILEKSPYALSLINSAQAHIARMLEPN